MKPVYGVALRPDAPLSLFKEHCTSIDLPEGTVLAMNCTEVRETSFGFLQLVPKQVGEIAPPTIYVPPSYILWMVRADDERQIGFRTGP